MSDTTARRGHIYRVARQNHTPILVLVTSINPANARRRRYITAAVSAERNAPDGMPDWVRLSSGDPVFGHVLCGELGMIRQDQIIEDLGEISLETTVKINQALKRTLGL